MSEINQRLQRMEAAGLIRIAAIDPDMEYLFRHALVQDAAYESLLKVDRKALHLLVGEAMEELYPYRLEEFAAVLGKHFYAAHDPRSFKYFVMAGDAAFRQSANAEAVTHFSYAWEIAREDNTVASAHLCHLCRRLGRTLQLTYRFTEAAELYESAIRLAQIRADQSLLLAAQVEYATVLSTRSPLQDYERGTALSYETLGLARELGDCRAEAASLWNLMLVESNRGDQRKAIPFGEQGLAIAREHNLPEQMAFLLGDLSHCYFANGEIARHQAAMEESMQIWRELGNLPMLAGNLTASAVGLFLAGQTELAIARWEESYEINRSIDNIWGQSFNGILLDLALLKNGRTDKALSVNQRTAALAKQIGNTFPLGGAKSVVLGLIHGMMGQAERGLALAESAFQSDGPDRWRTATMHMLPYLAIQYVWAGELSKAEAVIKEGYADLARGANMDNGSIAARLPIVVAELAFLRSDYPATLDAMQQLRSLIKQMGVSSFDPEPFFVEGRAYAGLNQPDDARQALEKSSELAEQNGERMLLWKSLALLSKVEMQSGRPVLAERYRQRAAEVIQFIADHAGREDLKASFLAMPEVRAVLSESS